MRFDVVTLFPELFGPHLSAGITQTTHQIGAFIGGNAAADTQENTFVAKIREHLDQGGRKNPNAKDTT